VNPENPYILAVAGLAVLVAIAAAGYAYDSRRLSRSLRAEMDARLTLIDARLEPWEVVAESIREVDAWLESPDEADRRAALYLPFEGGPHA
jgi:hypothetical protein